MPKCDFIWLPCDFRFSISASWYSCTSFQLLLYVSYLNFHVSLIQINWAMRCAILVNLHFIVAVCLNLNQTRWSLSNSSLDVVSNSETSQYNLHLCRFISFCDDNISTLTLSLSWYCVIGTYLICVKAWTSFGLFLSVLLMWRNWLIICHFLIIIIVIRNCHVRDQNMVIN